MPLKALDPGQPLVVEWLDAQVDVDVGGTTDEIPDNDPEAITRTIGWLVKITQTQVLLATDSYPHTNPIQFRSIVRIPLSLIQSIRQFGRGRPVSLTAKAISG